MEKTKLETMVARHEGYRKNMYRCPAGFLTIGYGYNLDAGMPEDEAHLLMRHRLATLGNSLVSLLPWFGSLSEARRDVLLNMAYQMGLSGLLKFKKALAAMDAGDFDAAAREMLDSKWARTDSPKRARELADIMRRGMY